MAAQIADAINKVLKPKGVAVVIEAARRCMTTRGIRKPGVTMVARRLIGAFETDAGLKARLPVVDLGIA
ncbi:GTP cyclohydrolase I [Bradyrhizobium sp. Arg314]